MRRLWNKCGKRWRTATTFWWLRRRIWLRRRGLVALLPDCWRRLSGSLWMLRRAIRNAGRRMRYRRRWLSWTSRQGCLSARDAASPDWSRFGVGSRIRPALAGDVHAGAGGLPGISDAELLAALLDPLTDRTRRCAWRRREPGPGGRRERGACCCGCWRCARRMSPRPR